MFLSNFLNFKFSVKSKNTGNTIREILNRIYRTQAYQDIANQKESLEVSGENTNEKMTKRIYRGQVYYCVPNQQKALKVNEVKTVELIYREQIYTRQIPVVSYKSPRAVNWRFR